MFNKIEQMDNNGKFGFVILHYGDRKMTQECVESIKKCTLGHAVSIVIVDNASPDKSGQRLAEYFQNDLDVTVILNKQNLGFANGNNVGYRFLREKKCDFICVMNNDVLLLQTDFTNRVVAAYNKHGFGVMGPHVTLPGNCENLFEFEMKPLSFYKSEYRRIYRLYKYYSSVLFPVREAVNAMIRKVQHIFVKNQEDNIEQKKDFRIYHQEHENVLLHGCCLIFSPLYMKQFDTCFCTETFMFKEEELLYMRCMENSIPTFYCPDIDVLHMEDVSTNAAYKTRRKKEIFVCGNQAKSLKILIRHMEDKNEKPFLTICLPCYNVEQHIEHCMDSILKQKYRNFELICVEDGSTDATLDILRRYEKQDRRVRLFVNDKNRKLLYARKRAIKNARGKYILQMDSDDCLVNGALEKMVRSLKQYNYPDVLEFKANIVLGSNRKPGAVMMNLLKKIKDDMTGFNYCRIYCGELRGKTILRELTDDNLGQMLWNKVVKASLLKKVYTYCDVDDLYYKEDVYACCILYALSKTYVGINDKLYNYSLYTGQSRKMFTQQNYFEMCKTGDIVKSLIGFFEKIGSLDQAAEELIYIKAKNWLKLLHDTMTENETLDREMCIEEVKRHYDFSSIYSISKKVYDTLTQMVEREMSAWKEEK